jgi:serine/threonine-protein kinase RsbW
MAIHLKITSEPESVVEVRRAIEQFCADAGFDEKATGEVGLVVNEAVANIIRHAYRGAVGKPIAMDADVADSAVHIRLRDWGSGEDPSRRPEKTDPLTPGGLGLVCMRRLMDELKFEPQKDGMLLLMSKRKNQKPEVNSRV